MSGRVGDDRIRHLQRLVGWAVDRAILQHNHSQKIKSNYRANRADVFWTPVEISAFEAGAPPHIARILIAATLTGLRPGDLTELNPAHGHPTRRGQRIVIWTAKRKRLASIPVMPRLAELIATTPSGMTHFSVNKAGQPCSHENYLGDAVSQWRDRLGIRFTLRLYDARSTAATRLLMADATLREVATAMGWSLKRAAEVIERYATLSPEMTDDVAEKLAQAKKIP